jgi:hypothetical protein
VLEPSATRRDTFALRISRTHVTFGMPAYDLWWVDADVDDLGWDRGVVQLGHHSGGTLACQQRGEPGVPPGCEQNTWHWDNVEIAPAAPFTILRGVQPFVDATTSPEVVFLAPAPVGAHLRFVAMGQQVEVSFDGGRNWQPAERKEGRSRFVGPQSLVFASYWSPVPPGTMRVQIRARQWLDDFKFARWMPWLARGISIWALPGEAP